MRKPIGAIAGKTKLYLELEFDNEGWYETIDVISRCVEFETGGILVGKNGLSSAYGWVKIISTTAGCFKLDIEVDLVIETIGTIIGWDVTISDIAGWIIEAIVDSFELEAVGWELIVRGSVGDIDTRYRAAAISMPKSMKTVNT